MTATYRTKPGHGAAWTNTEDGEVVLCLSGGIQYFMTPEQALHLAEDLRRAAEKAVEKR